jgi:uncharacterized membrane protein
MFCPSCGEEIPDGAEFCSHCGDEVSAAEPAGDAGGSPAGGGTAAQPRGARATSRQTGVAGGLEENVAGALAYALGFVSGLVFFLIEEDNEFVRFHAVQSMVVFGAATVAWFVVNVLQGFFGWTGFGTATLGASLFTWLIGVLLWILYAVLSIAIFVLWLVLISKAYNGERWSLPVAGGIAENHA